MQITNKNEINEIVTNGQMNFPEGVNNETEIFVRGEISRLSCLNTIYKDGNKYYIEGSVETEMRICKRAKVENNEYNWEDAGYYLLCAGYEMKEAVRMLREANL